jgi:hypothetical protein
LALVGSLAFASTVSAAVVFADDFDGPTTFFRARQNYDSLGVHPPDVGQDPWQQNGVLRDGSDAGYPAPKAGTGGTFYGEPGLLPTYRRLDGWLTPAGGAATLNQVVRYNWDVYVQSYSGSDPFSGFEFSTFSTPGLAGGGIRGHDIWLAADGTLGYYTGSEGLVYVPSNEFSFSTDTWISPQLVVDYSTGAASLTIGSQTKNFSFITSGANRADQLILSNASTGNHLALFDNIQVSVVPEPASLSLAALGAVSLRRRNRKA